MVALLLTGVVFMLGVVGPNNQKDEYYVPNFVGKNYEEEIANKQEYIENLSINVQYVNSDEVAEGYVISQDPKGAAGQGQIHCQAGGQQRPQRNRYSPGIGK